MKYIDITGQKFGRLKVIGKDPLDKSKIICICDCGNEKPFDKKAVKRGHTKSCGCLERSCIDITGEKYGRWTVLRLDPDNNQQAICRCDCGVERSVVKGSIKNGHSKSCGCWNIEAIIIRNTIHGQSNHPLWGIWNNINERCYNPNNPLYKYYGAVGVKNGFVDFPDFCDFIENVLKAKPTCLYSLDRYPNHKGNYCRDNLRLATSSEQKLNRRNKTIKSSKFRGVCFDKRHKKWTANIKINGANIYLGRYINEEDAAEVFLQAYFKHYKVWPPEFRGTPLCYISPLKYLENGGKTL